MEKNGDLRKIVRYSRHTHFWGIPKYSNNGSPTVFLITVMTGDFFLKLSLIFTKFKGYIKGSPQDVGLQSPARLSIALDIVYNSVCQPF